ncbi:C-terminal binding protein [Acuticoccus yangtzensis]|uniref:C-terminal binding protein n=1 Tax=Acuticoccus yangtzensis TaxID=1443441 RepID=UPI0009496B21|nr:C-terminal binding protein [Acuticoccus yangtzensis]
MTRIAIIDPQFDGTPDIELDEAGADTEFTILRPGYDPVDPAALDGADALVNCRSRHYITRSLVEAFTTVKVVVQAGVGFNHIDLDACAERGIPVCNTPDYGTMEVADHAIGLMLALSRGIPTYAERLWTRDDAWGTHALPLPPVRRLSVRTFGVLGLGRIGTAAALRARAFGMRIVFYDPYLPAGAELALGFERAASLEALLAESDIVSVHCPLTAETTEIVDDAFIAAMKEGAVLINTARGGTMDLSAVERGLRSGALCAAGLDVLPKEPLDRSHPLIVAWGAREPWLDGRLIITPHAAFYSPEGLADMRRLSTRAAMAYLTHGTVRSCVNARELERHGFSVGG